MTSVQVVGIGLDGAAGLTKPVLLLIEMATLLIGSERHLSYFPDHTAQKWVLGDLNAAVEMIRRRLLTQPQTENTEPDPTPVPLASALPWSLVEEELIVILVSGDPLYFGLGRLLLAKLPPETITFHPHLSSVQLAFNRIKIPWHDARVISAHGRSLDELQEALRQGTEKIATLTDSQRNPAAIAQLLLSLDLPILYEMWVCENLGGTDERIQSWLMADSKALEHLQQQNFHPLNLVVLRRRPDTERQPINLSTLPVMGLPDQMFLSFSDRPGLMTKREVRLLVLGELAINPGQIIWDVGSGTGSVAIEIARLSQSTQVYAIEKSAAGTSLIEENCRRFSVKNVISINGKAPEILYHLPAPDRIFIGGTGGQLRQILGVCGSQLKPGGVLVLALATLEHLNDALFWITERTRRLKGWNYRLLQVQLSRSVPVASLTRFSPLNPVTILTIIRE